MLIKTFRLKNEMLLMLIIRDKLLIDNKLIKYNINIKFFTVML